MAQGTIQVHLDELRREHWHDGDGGAAEFQDLWNWYKSADLDFRGAIREVLLANVAAGRPLNWGMALAVLTEDASSVTANELEKIARSMQGRSELRDSVILSLARIGHRPAIDLCLDGINAGRQFLADESQLLANLIRLDVEIGLALATAYFTDSLTSLGKRSEQAENCCGTFLAVYEDANRACILELVRRTLAGSTSAGQTLLRAMLRWCDMLIPGYSAAAAAQGESMRFVRLELLRLQSNLQVRK